MSEIDARGKQACPDSPNEGPVNQPNNTLPQDTVTQDTITPQRLGDGIADFRQAATNAANTLAWAGKIAQEVEGLVSAFIAGKASVHVKYLGGSEVAIKVVKD